MIPSKLKLNNFNADWAVCAFGKEEFSCLELSVKLGGKVRVGFENSIYLPNGDVAADNETKVDVINRLLNLN